MEKRFFDVKGNELFAGDLVAEPNKRLTHYPEIPKEWVQFKLQRLDYKQKLHLSRYNPSLDLEGLYEVDPMTGDVMVISEIAWKLRAPFPSSNSVLSYQDILQYVLKTE